MWKSIQYLLSAILGIVFIVVLTGLAVQEFVPGCECTLESCSNCGGIIGHFFARFSIVCFALGAIGFVLAIWFGIPLVILGAIIVAVFKFFNKSKPLNLDE
jgi:hypothetical protein